MADIVKVEGLRELNNKLRKLPVNVANKHLSSAVSKAATIVVKSAKQKVPVLTGTVLRNIKKRKKRTPNKMISKYDVGVESDRSGRSSGTDAFYWKFIEFGTSKMEARPFIRPAFEENKELSVNKIRESLAIAVELEAKKA